MLTLTPRKRFVSRVIISPLKSFYAPENGTHPGIDVELLQSISEQMNLKAHLRVFPRKRAHAMVQTGEMDALCSCSYLKNERLILSLPTLLVRM